MNPRQRSILVWALVGLAAIALTMYALRAKPIAVETAKVGTQDLRIERVDQGYTRVRELYSISAPVSGQLQRITLEAGDPISLGQTLAELSPAASTPLDPRSAAAAAAAVDTASARVREAEAALASARDWLERSEAMFKQQLVAERDLTSARTLERESSARLAAARASLRQAQVSASWQSQGSDRVLQLSAPIEGVVLKRWQESAGVVAAGTPLLELGDPRDLEVVAEFLSQEAAGISVGATAVIEAWGGPDLPAVVERIEPLGELKISALGVEERRVRIILKLLAPTERLGHGFQVDARITVEQLNQVLAVPLEALQRAGEGWFVWRVVDRRVEKVAVEVGSSDGRVRMVARGLSPGDEVVLNPSDQLAAGMRVDITR